jgi:hypothetical protein
LYEGGTTRVLFQRPAKLENGRVDAAFEIEKDLVPPESSCNFFSRDQFIPPLQHQQKQLHRNPLQHDRAAAARQFTGGDVKFKITEPQSFRWHRASLVAPEAQV